MKKITQSNIRKVDCVLINSIIEDMSQHTI